MKKEERRKAVRRPILESFSFFLTISGKTDYRLAVADVSTHGIGFYLDIDGIISPGLELTLGDEIEVNLYLNQTLYLPLKVKAVRIDKVEKRTQVGGEITDLKSKEYQSFKSFVSFLDSLTEVAYIEQ